ncbi:MAG: restriction endonuclease [Dehalococcoidia bacterium]|nr:restriction endonuclease [Dehalococcoidia bacterium]MDH4299485.1 restriction endonuclease [Dehalococcoidia bacterium]
MEGLLIIIGILAGITLISALIHKISDLRGKAKKYVELKPRLDNLDKYKGELESKESELKRKQKDWETEVQSDIHAIETLVKEKTEGFPWLAKAYADYAYLKDLNKASHLQHKSHPAPKAAEQVRQVASQRRVAERLYRVLKYKLEYYENLFPWLIDFTGEDIDDLIRQIMERKEKGKEEPHELEDPVKRWLTQSEYSQLPVAERNQRALDRYWRKPKTKWEIGRDYERYIGYLYESKGYGVYYQGIVEGLADLGRDLVCVKDKRVEVVQCKCWSQEKRIHEKHIFQLLGTVIAYRIDHPAMQVIPWFITSTTLSDRARQFAGALDIKLTENHPLGRYPSIKCNISRRDGTKIYHLPFDQQYDRTLIEEERNERYVETVKETEELGFRRAFRWHGSADSTTLT